MNMSEADAGERERDPLIAEGGRSGGGDAEGANKRVRLHTGNDLQAIVTGEGLSDVIEVPGRAREKELAHPCLFNETILDNIFKFIIRQPSSKKDVATDVKNIRLVCHSWKDSVTRLYRRSRASAMFKNGRRGGGAPFRKVSLGVFLDTMKGSSLIPVQSFTIFGDLLLSHRNLKMFNDFIRLCGPTMVVLKFYMSGDSKHVTKFSQSNINIGGWNLGKLKYLAFFIFDLGKAITANGLRTLAGACLKGAKNLSQFWFVYFPLLRTPQTDILLRQMGETICSQVSTTIKELQLHLILSEDAISQLAERGFKLDSFMLSYSSGLALEGGALLKFLESQANTLKHFRLSHRDRSSNPGGVSWAIPRLRELTHLVLVDGIAAPFSFGGSFPKLQFLDASGMKDEIFVELLSRSISPTVKILHLPEWFRTPQLVKEAAEHFPNVEELYISPFSADVAGILEQVYIHFRSIKELHISFRRELNLDSALTGVAEGDCKRWQRHANLGALQERQSILNLTKLRKLTLKNVSAEGRQAASVTISDFTAQFAFLQMAQLKELCLIGIGMQISPRYMGQLKDKLTLEVKEGGDH